MGNSVRGDDAGPGPVQSVDRAAAILEILARDGEAGVTEGMVRHWILSFGEDARHFADFAKKLQALEK